MAALDTRTDDPFLDEEWLAAPTRRSRTRSVLLAAVALSLVFLAGALVQKHYGTAAATVGGAPTAAGIPSGFTGRPPSGFTGGATATTPDDATATTTDATTSVIGTVVSRDGDTWVVEDLGGTRHTVVVSDDTRVTREERLTTDDVAGGDTVTITGAGDDELTATAVTVR